MRTLLLFLQSAEWGEITDPTTSIQLAPTAFLPAQVRYPCTTTDGSSYSARIDREFTEHKRVVMQFQGMCPLPSGKTHKRKPGT